MRHVNALLGGLVLFGAVLTVGQAAETPAAPDVEQAAHTFRFAGGEKILIQICDEPHGEIWQLEQMVLPDGRISSVRFGTVHILGTTLQEAEDAVIAAYKKRAGVQAPLVSLILSAVPVQKVNVEGQVTQPKIVEIPFAGQLSLAAALTEAGGLTDDADSTKIKILHRLPSNAVVLDTVDATEFARPGSKYAGPILMPGDNIVVPRAEAFSVLGEVKRPGIVTRRTSRTPPGVPIRLSNALAAVGGLNNNAEREHINVLRTDENGKRNTLTVNANATEKGDLDQDPILRDGDQVLVPASEGIMILGAVMSPGIYYIPVGPPTLSRLIALAGGLQTYAKSDVLLVHKQGPKENIDLNSILEKGHTEKDMALIPGDWVHVPGSPY